MEFYELVYEVVHGEASHNEYEHFYGTFEEAKEYAKRVHKVYFGKGTHFFADDARWAFDQTMQFRVCVYEVRPLSQYKHFNTATGIKRFKVLYEEVK